MTPPKAMLPAYNLKLVMSEANLCRQHREPDVGSFWIILEANLAVELTPDGTLRR